jgi:hypothetical protein
MLAGVPPFAGETFAEVLAKHVRDQVVAPSKIRPDLCQPGPLEELLLACLQKDPDKRPSVRELSRRLSLLGEARLSLASSPQASATVALSKRRASSKLPARALALASAAAALLALFFLGRSAERAPQPDPTPHKATEIAPRPASAQIAQGPAMARDAGFDARQALPDAASRRARTQPEPDPRIKEHLAEAERARRAGKFLKQLTEADAVLRIAPHHRRALFLAGDALVRSGDKVRGCARLKNSSKARWRAAGCSD